MHWQNLINVALNFNQVHSTATTTTTTWHYLHAKLTCDRRLVDDGTGNGCRGRQVAPFDKHDTTRLQRVFHLSPPPHPLSTTILQESALFAIHIHTYKYIYIHTYVVPARFIMSIEIANCDFSFRDAKLIRDPDTREICGECTVAFWPLLNQISCRFALQLQLLLLPAACCCPKSASKAFENIHFANNSIAMCKQRGRGSGRDPFASTAICSLATITAKYANKFVTMQQRTCLSGSVYRLSPSARLVAPNNVLQHGAKHRLLPLPPRLLLYSAL